MGGWYQVPSWSLSHVLSKGVGYLWFHVPSGEGGYTLPPVIHYPIASSQNHKSARYASYWNVFLYLFISAGFVSYLRQVHNVAMPPNPLWNCKIANPAVFTSMMWSTLFILSMTFERFYGIILPHKAASFNTVKRAKLTIVSCVIFSILFNLPNLFYSTTNSVSCSYNTSLPLFYVYYWLTFVLSFLLPFIFLLIMNGVIIHTLRTRSIKNLVKFRNLGQGQNEGQALKMKSIERQIYVTLLLVTFGFLILTTPSKILPLYVQAFGFGDTPTKFTEFCRNWKNLNRLSIRIGDNCWARRTIE